MDYVSTTVLNLNQAPMSPLITITTVFIQFVFMINMYRIIEVKCLISIKIRASPALDERWCFYHHGNQIPMCLLRWYQFGVHYTRNNVHSMVVSYV